MCLGVWSMFWFVCVCGMLCLGDEDDEDAGTQYEYQSSL